MKIRQLKESNKFLNQLLDNITSAVFIVDEETKIQEVNRFCKVLFKREAKEMVTRRCGEGIGCINQHIYNMDCGTTPICENCGLRNGIIKTFEKGEMTNQKIMERDFIISDDRYHKFLEYSIRSMMYNEEKMVLVIIHDITEMEHQKREIQKLNDEMNYELDIAKNIQKGLMPPKHIENDNMEIDIYYNPFMKISGDFYDIIELDKDRKIIFLSDITGHGIPASLYISMLKKELGDIIKETDDPSEMLGLLNNHLNENIQAGYYFPTLIMLLDFSKNKLIYSNAGSDKPIIIKDKKVKTLEEQGPILGLIPDTKFQNKEVDFKKGDEIYVFTDGIITLESQGDIQQVPRDYLINFFEKYNSDGIDKLRTYKNYILNYSEDAKWGDDVTIIEIKIK